MRLTPQQVHILLHATGWETRNPLYRNRYTPSAGNVRHCERLMKVGLMECTRRPTAEPNDWGGYAVTEAGIAYLVKRERRLNAVKKEGAK